MVAKFEYRTIWKLKTFATDLSQELGNRIGKFVCCLTKNTQNRQTGFIRWPGNRRLSGHPYLLVASIPADETIKEPLKNCRFERQSFLRWVKDFNNRPFFHQNSRIFSKTSSFLGLFSNFRRNEVATFICITA